MKSKIILKYSLIFLFSVGLIFSGFSQKNHSKYSYTSFEKNNFILSLGMGTDDKFSYDFLNKSDLFYTYEVFWGYNSYYEYIKMNSPFYLKAEFALSDRFSLGMHVNRNTAYTEVRSTESSGNNNVVIKTNWTTLSVIPRMNFNFPVEKNFCVYFGFGLGYHQLSYKSVTYDLSGNELSKNTTTENKTENPVAIETSIGMRYFPIKNVGIYWELGLSKSPLQGGLVFKI